MQLPTLPIAIDKSGMDSRALQPQLAPTLQLLKLLQQFASGYAPVFKKRYKAIIATAVATAHISAVVMFPLVILMPTAELYRKGT